LIIDGAGVCRPPFLIRGSFDPVKFAEFILRLAFAGIIISCGLVFAEDAQLDTTGFYVPPPVTDVQVYDKPNDQGHTLIVEWSIPDTINLGELHLDGFRVYRSADPSGPFESVAELPSGSTRYENSGLKNGTSYFYKITSFSDGAESSGAVGGPAVPRGQWFNTERIPILILVVLFAATALIFIFRAKRGYEFYVRPIAGIKAVDDAIGRATEMGRPILYVPGLGTAADVATIAAFTILGRVARKVVEYNTRVIVPNYDPVVMTVCQEVVKEAYSAAGKPELYDPKDVYFITQDQFPYTAAVNGIMLREKPATNFYMGMFYAESLVLAETGFISGSIQIAGTDQLVQIPFFVSVCDFVLMGEELYAASAYLSQEPQQLGTLKAQDWGKVLVVVLMIIGVVFSTLGYAWFAGWFDIG
jgi:hypothetical protein